MSFYYVIQKMTYYTRRTHLSRYIDKKGYKNHSMHKKRVKQKSGLGDFSGKNKIIYTGCKIFYIGCLMKKGGSKICLLREMDGWKWSEK